MKSQGLSDGGGGDGGVPLFLANFPNGLLSDFRLPRRPLMVRAALLRRSRCCDGVAAATEMRRPAPSRSFCASREEPASFPPVDSNFKSWPTVLGQPPGPVIIKTKKNAGKVLGSKPGERQGKPTTQGQGFEYNSRRTRGAEQYRRQYQNGCRRDE